MLNVISSSEKKDSASSDVTMASIQTGTGTGPLGGSDTYNLLTGNSPHKIIPSYPTKPSGIPLASGSIPGSSSLSGTANHTRPVSTTFSSRVDASALTSGMVPVLPVMTAITTPSIDKSTTPIILSKSSPPKTTPTSTSTGVATGMSVKEMIGNISKRKSSLPIAAAGGYSGTSTPTEEEGSRSPTNVTVNKLSDELLKKYPQREGRSTSPVSYPRPTNSSLLRKSPSARGLGGNGVVKWGDGPGASMASERSRGGRSASPHERDSDLSSLSGTPESLYCASTGRKLTTSDSSKDINGLPYEVGSVRGVVASWDHRENSHVRDTAKSRATKEATMQKDLTPGARVSLLEKRCTF